MSIIWLPTMKGMCIALSISDDIPNVSIPCSQVPEEDALEIGTEFDSMGDIEIMTRSNRLRYPVYLDEVGTLRAIGVLIEALNKRGNTYYLRTRGIALEGKAEGD